MACSRCLNGASRSGIRLIGRRDEAAGAAHGRPREAGMRKFALLCTAAFLGLAAFEAAAADKFTIQLKWVTQAQFAGYYVAKDKGFYKDANLDVTIKPGGPDIAPEQVIAGGGADVIVDWMPAALAAREKGVKLVNIAQPFKHSGLE